MNLLKENKFCFRLFLLSCLLTTIPSLANSLSAAKAPPLLATPPATEKTSPPTDTHTSIWKSMGDSFSLNHQVDQAKVDRQISLLQRNQRALYQTLEKAAPYISYIYDQTKKEGLPTELALLPLIESKFNPNARSVFGATGVWQIMPETAYRLGLKNNYAYDGRRDLVASTHAALGYLNHLHSIFRKDWEMALAAYNWGPGNVQMAIRRQGSWYTANFWHLRLPTQTQNYVPQLLALAEVIKNPDRYHIRLPNISDNLHLASVQVGAHVNLQQVANSTGVSIKTLAKLNPGYTRLATTKGAPNTLLIPENSNAPESLLLTTNSDLLKSNISSVLASKVVAPILLASQSTTKDKSSDYLIATTLLHEGKWLLAV